jgi:hypothetical protein
MLPSPFRKTIPKKVGGTDQVPAQAGDAGVFAGKIQRAAAPPNLDSPCHYVTPQNVSQSAVVEICARNRPISNPGEDYCYELALSPCTVDVIATGSALRHAWLNLNRRNASPTAA